MSKPSKKSSNETKRKAVKVKHKNRPVHIPLPFEKAVETFLQVKPKKHT